MMCNALALLKPKRILVITWVSIHPTTWSDPCHIWHDGVLVMCLNPAFSLLLKEISKERFLSSYLFVWFFDPNCIPFTYVPLYYYYRYNTTTVVLQRLHVSVEHCNVLHPLLFNMIGGNVWSFQLHLKQQCCLHKRRMDCEQLQLNRWISSIIGIVVVHTRCLCVLTRQGWHCPGDVRSLPCNVAIKIDMSSRGILLQTRCDDRMFL